MQPQDHNPASSPLAVRGGCNHGPDEPMGRAFTQAIATAQPREAVARGLVEHAVAALPAPPSAISHVEGPFLQVARVLDDPGAVDVRVVTGFRAHYSSSNHRDLQAALNDQQGTATVTGALGLTGACSIHSIPSAEGGTRNMNAASSMDWSTPAHAADDSHATDEPDPFHASASYNNSALRSEAGLMPAPPAPPISPTASMQAEPARWHHAQPGAASPFAAACLAPFSTSSLGSRAGQSAAGASPFANSTAPEAASQMESDGSLGSPVGHKRSCTTEELNPRSPRKRSLDPVSRTVHLMSATGAPPPASPVSRGYTLITRHSADQPGQQVNNSPLTGAQQQQHDLSNMQVTLRAPAGSQQVMTPTPLMMHLPHQQQQQQQQQASALMSSGSQLALTVRQQAGGAGQEGAAHTVAGLREWELDMSEIHLIRRLAVGGFAEVFLGRYQGTLVAVKRLFADDKEIVARFAREVRVLMRLRHPNLILFMGYTLRPEPCIISEYMSRGSLFSIMRQRANSSGSGSSPDKHVPGGVGLDTQGLGGQHSAPDAGGGSTGRLEVRLQHAVAIAVARGMAYLHTRNPPILHLDLKSPNILADNAWRIKIADFGLSTTRQHTWVTSGNAGGTPEWMAPEVLRCEHYDEKADVFSYGVVLWELITGEVPWHEYNPMQVVGVVGYSGRTLPIPTSGDPLLRQLCAQCMSYTPACRPSFPEILTLLEQHLQPGASKVSHASDPQGLLGPQHRPLIQDASTDLSLGKQAQHAQQPTVIEPSSSESQHSRGQQSGSPGPAWHASGDAGPASAPPPASGGQLGAGQVLVSELAHQEAGLGRAGGATATGVHSLSATPAQWQQQMIGYTRSSSLGRGRDVQLMDSMITEDHAFTQQADDQEASPDCGQPAQSEQHDQQQHMSDAWQEEWQVRSLKPLPKLRTICSAQSLHGSAGTLSGSVDSPRSPRMIEGPAGKGAGGGGGGGGGAGGARVTGSCDGYLSVGQRRKARSPMTQGEDTCPDSQTRSVAPKPDHHDDMPSPRQLMQPQQPAVRAPAASLPGPGSNPTSPGAGGGMSSVGPPRYAGVGGHLRLAAQHRRSNSFSMLARNPVLAQLMKSNTQQAEGGEGGKGPSTHPGSDVHMAAPASPDRVYRRSKSINDVHAAHVQAPEDRSKSDGQQGGGQAGQAGIQQVPSDVSQQLSEMLGPELSGGVHQVAAFAHPQPISTFALPRPAVTYQPSAAVAAMVKMASMSEPSTARDPPQQPSSARYPAPRSTAQHRRVVSDDMRHITGAHEAPLPTWVLPPCDEISLQWPASDMMDLPELGSRASGGTATDESLFSGRLIHASSSSAWDIPISLWPSRLPPTNTDGSRNAYEVGSVCTDITLARSVLGSCASSSGGANTPVSLASLHDFSFAQVTRAASMPRTSSQAWSRLQHGHREARGGTASLLASQHTSRDGTSDGLGGLPVGQLGGLQGAVPEHQAWPPPEATPGPSPKTTQLSPFSEATAQQLCFSFPSPPAQQHQTPYLDPAAASQQERVVPKAVKFSIGESQSVPIAISSPSKAEFGEHKHGEEGLASMSWRPSRLTSDEVPVGSPDVADLPGGSDWLRHANAARIWRSGRFKVTDFGAPSSPPSPGGLTPSSPTPQLLSGGTSPTRAGHHSMISPAGSRGPSRESSLAGAGGSAADSPSRATSSSREDLEGSGAGTKWGSTMMYRKGRFFVSSTQLLDLGHDGEGGLPDHADSDDEGPGSSHGGAVAGLHIPPRQPVLQHASPSVLLPSHTSLQHPPPGSMHPAPHTSSLSMGGVPVCTAAGGTASQALLRGSATEELDLSRSFPAAPGPPVLIQRTYQKGRFDVVECLSAAASGDACSLCSLERAHSPAVTSAQNSLAGATSGSVPYTTSFTDAHAYVGPAPASAQLPPLPPSVHGKTEASGGVGAGEGSQAVSQLHHAGSDSLGGHTKVGRFTIMVETCRSNTGSEAGAALEPASAATGRLELQEQQLGGAGTAAAPSEPARRVVGFGGVPPPPPIDTSSADPNRSGGGAAGPLTGTYSRTKSKGRFTVIEESPSPLPSPSVPTAAAAVRSSQEVQAAGGEATLALLPPRSPCHLRGSSPLSKEAVTCQGGPAGVSAREEDVRSMILARMQGREGGNAHAVQQQLHLVPHSSSYQVCTPGGACDMDVGSQGGARQVQEGGQLPGGQTDMDTSAEYTIEVAGVSSAGLLALDVVLGGSEPQTQAEPGLTVQLMFGGDTEPQG